MSKNIALDRREVVANLLKDRKDLLVVSGLGSATYDCAAVGDHPNNFYLWGAMGGTASLAFGLALAQPRRPILALTGALASWIMKDASTQSVEKFVNKIIVVVMPADFNNKDI